MRWRAGGAVAYCAGTGACSWCCDGCGGGGGCACSSAPPLGSAGGALANAPTCWTDAAAPSPIMPGGRGPAFAPGALAGLEGARSREHGAGSREQGAGAGARWRWGRRSQAVAAAQRALAPVSFAPVLLARAPAQRLAVRCREPPPICQRQATHVCRKCAVKARWTRWLAL